MERGKIRDFPLLESQEQKNGGDRAESYAQVEDHKPGSLYLPVGSCLDSTAVLGWTRIYPTLPRSEPVRSFPDKAKCSECTEELDQGWGTVVA